jgi:hypothetical protein
MAMKDVELPYQHGKEKSNSKLVRSWHLEVSSDRKQVEISIQTMDGTWHSLYLITDKIAIDTIMGGKESGKQS